MLTLSSPTAWIICWSLDETKVRIRPEGKNGKQAIWVPVQRDELGHPFCEYKGKQFRIWI